MQVQRDSPHGAGDRNHHDKTRGALIVEIGGNHEHWPAAGVLAASGRIQLR